MHIVETKYRSFPDGYQALFLKDPDGKIAKMAKHILQLIELRRLSDPFSFMDWIATYNPYNKFPDIDPNLLSIRFTSRKLHCTVTRRPDNTTLILDDNNIMIYPSDPVRLDDGSTRIGWITIGVSNNIDVPHGVPHVTIGSIQYR